MNLKRNIIKTIKKLRKVGLPFKPRGKENHVWEKLKKKLKCSGLEKNPK